MKNKNLLNLKNLKHKDNDDKTLINSSRSDEIYFNKQIFVESLTDRNCKNCNNYKHLLQKISTQYEKEKKNYTYLLNFKDIALKKRDEMLYVYNQENLELRAKLKKLDLILYKSDGKIINSQTNIEKVHELEQSPQRSIFKGSKKEAINTSLKRSSSKNMSRGRVSSFIGNSVPLFSSEGDGMLNILMEEGEKILNHPKILELEDFLKINSSYLETFNRFSSITQNEIFLTINLLFSEYKNNINLVCRLSKLMKSCQNLSTSLVVDDALNLIVKETCDNLICDRASVFLLDEEKGELWTKAAKGTKKIKVPLNRGIVGYVAINNTSIKIDNAYSDPRFNREIDKLTNYNTKTILSVPIRDINEKVVGVIQAVNKLKGTFSPDDERLLTILANQAGLILRNSLMYDKLVVNQYKLLKLVNIGMHLFQSVNLEMVMIRAKEKLMDLTNTEKCLIYLYDHENEVLLRYDIDKNVKIYEIDGIIGECLKTGAQIETPRPDIDPLFNNRVDLDTHLALLTIPVKSEQFNQIIAIFQLSDFHSSLSKSLGKANNFDMEIINFFIKIFTICIENALNFKKKIEVLKGSEIIKENKNKFFKRMSVAEKV